MGYRGRLIFKFMCEIAPIDIGASAVSNGYDSEFRERKIVPTADRIGNTKRVEGPMYRIPAQFGSTDQFRRLQMMATGNADSNGFTILFHFKDLEQLGLVESFTQNSLLKVGDRLNAIYDYRTGVLVQQLPMSCAVYVTEAQPIFGMGGTRNLLACTFKDREPGQ